MTNIEITSIDVWQTSLHNRRPESQMFCRNCIYWQCDSWQDEIQLVKEIAANDGLWTDVTGFCRRHAPTPAQAFQQRTTQMAGEAAWALNVTASIEQDKTQDYGAEGQDIFEVHEWPLTNANAWCGEFRAGRKLPTAEELKELAELPS